MGAGEIPPPFFVRSIRLSVVAIHVQLAEGAEKVLQAVDLNLVYSAQHVA